MIERHPNADAMWSDDGKVDALHKMWNRSLGPLPLKVIAWVDDLRPKSVLDLGCGTGRYARLLKWEKYKGYDVYPEMIRLAKTIAPEGAAFGVRDVLAKGLKTRYDLALFLDVAMHQNMPMASIAKAMKLWRAERFIFNLLVGARKKDVGMAWMVNRKVARVFLAELPVERRHILPQGDKETWLVQTLNPNK